MLLELTIAVFGFILTILGTMLISYFREMKSDVKQMSASMVEMNTKLEKVITDQSWHKEEIMDIKERISSLERSKTHGKV